MFSKIKTSFGIVFREKKYILFAGICAFLMSILYMFTSQIITIFSDGVFFELSLIRITTLLAISILFGIVLAMQVYFVRISSFRAKEAGVAAGGLLTGMFALTCCAPVLPTFLVLFGFSGTFLLSTTAFFGKYFLYFSFLSIGLLLISVIVLSRSLTDICKINKFKDKKLN
ncbi:MAG: hypothetical protein HY831_02235 [Candidatus Aenigmarchaeota archaeon]|nr:hypothetical protein [Candidatus Aenigmarchaeota archaeon]